MSASIGPEVCSASPSNMLATAASTLLNQHPMIMAHDAATTYLGAGLVDRWAKTQPDGGFAGLLGCGVRAFDLRPAVASGVLVMHHGSITVDHPLASALDEVVSWANANATSAEELIVLSTGDFTGGGCEAAVEQAFAARNITYLSDCASLQGLTLAAAAQRAVLPGGGLVLAVSMGCVSSHYQPEIACSGYTTSGVANPPTEERLPSQYTCYSDSGSKQLPLQRMWSYLANVSAAGPPSDGTLYGHQALWQESDASVAVGALHGSSLLSDEERSTLNALLTSRVGSGAWDVSRANLVEINNVCDGGPALLAALRGARRVVAV